MAHTETTKPNIIDSIHKLTQEIEELGEMTNQELQEIQNNIQVMLQVLDFQTIKHQAKKQLSRLLKDVTNLNVKTDMGKVDTVKELLFKINARIERN